MSQGDAVRIRLGADPPAARSLDERVMVRVPALARLAGRAIQRLPLTSRLRRKFVARAVRRGYAATSRGDYALASLAYDPNVEIHMRESAAVSADLVGVYRGHDGWHRLIGELLDVWEFAWYPEEVLDCGERVLISLRIETRGRGSGIPLTRQMFDVLTWGRDGLVIRQEVFGEREQALEAVGLRE
jgi:ketosteroid isomerase-like protein